MMENKDNETLEDIANILIILDRGDLSDGEAIERIMKVTIKNANEKLKNYLNENKEVEDGKD